MSSKKAVIKKASEVQKGDYLIERGGAAMEVVDVVNTNNRVDITIDARMWISMGAKHRELHFKPNTKVCVI